MYGRFRKEICNESAKPNIIADPGDDDREIYHKVRIIGYGETQEEVETTDNDVLGRGKRVMCKKQYMDSPETYRAKTVPGEDESDKQRLKNKRHLENIKKAVSNASIAKLALCAAEVLPALTAVRVPLQEVCENEQNCRNGDKEKNEGDSTKREKRGMNVEDEGKNGRSLDKSEVPEVTTPNQVSIVVRRDETIKSIASHNHAERIRRIAELKQNDKDTMVEKTLKRRDVSDTQTMFVERKKKLNDGTTSQRDHHEKEEAALNRSKRQKIQDAMKEIRKLTALMNTKVRKLEQMIEVNSGEDSEVDMLEIPSEDSNDVEIIPGWHISQETLIAAASASSMNKRLAVLMSALWSKEERTKLVVRKAKKGNDDVREISAEEIKQLMRGCIKLQSMKKLRMEAVDTTEKIKVMISNKLKNDRYNNNLRRRDSNKKRRQKKNKNGDNNNEEPDDIDDNDSDNDNNSNATN